MAHCRAVQVGEVNGSRRITFNGNGNPIDQNTEIHCETGDNLGFCTDSGTLTITWDGNSPVYPDFGTINHRCGYSNVTATAAQNYKFTIQLDDGGPGTPPSVDPKVIIDPGGHFIDLLKDLPVWLDAIILVVAGFGLLFFRNLFIKRSA